LVQLYGKYSTKL